MFFLVFLIIPLVLGMWAQSRVQFAYGTYSQVRSRSGMTGREVAIRVMEQAGISDVRVTSCSGHLVVLKLLRQPETRPDPDPDPLAKAFKFPLVQ